MATPDLPPTFSIASIDAQRVEEGLARIGPKWTTWTAMTLAQVRGPVRVRDVAAQLPFVSEQFVGKRLATMHADGLVVRDYDRRGAPYQLSALGTSLAPVLRTVSDWSRTHLTQEPMAEAERVEDALRRLYLRHSTAVVQALDSADGQMRFVHIAEAAGLDYGLARQRLVRLQADGLVTRTGSRHGDPYVLTDAGQALGAVYTSVEHWSQPFSLRSGTARHRVRPRQPRGPTSAFRWGREPRAPGPRRPYDGAPPPRTSRSATRLSRNRGCRRP
ncbi:winged helix-turn-helix transcriptional regulator [Streptomyces sp. NPDC001665]